MERIQDENYTGTEIIQDVIVTDGSRILEKDIDYTVSYSHNINPGRATITISGKLQYKGKITCTFNILPVTTPTVKPTVAPSTAQPAATPSEKQSVTSPEDDENSKPGKVSISSIKSSKKKLTIKWKQVSKVSDYQIQVAQNKKFTKGKKTYNVSKSTAKKVFKGKAKTIYYVRIRAYVYDSWGFKEFGKYSAVKKKKTK